MTSPHDLRPVRTSHSISFSIIIHPTENESTVAVHQYNQCTQHPCPAATRQHVLWLLLMSPNTLRATKTSPHAVCPGNNQCKALPAHSNDIYTHLLSRRRQKSQHFGCLALTLCGTHAAAPAGKSIFLTALLLDAGGLRGKKKKKMPQRWLCQKLNNFGSHKSKIDHGCLKDNAGRESWQPLQNKTCFSTTVSSSLPGWAAAAAAAA